MRTVAQYSSHDHQKQPFLVRLKTWWMEVSGGKPNLSLLDALSLVAVIILEYIAIAQSPNVPDVLARFIMLIWFILPIVVYTARMAVSIITIKFQGGFITEDMFRAIKRNNFWYSLFYGLIILPLLIAFFIKTF